MLLSPALATAADSRISVPPGLQRDVDFWVRVYSEISTSEGFLHDDRDLSLVYRKLRFESDVTPRQRRDAVDAERVRLEAMLKRLAAGAQDLSEEEQKLAQLFGSNASRQRYAEAARQVRFQLGQSDRFRQGLERSGTWESHIAKTFARLGLPPELAALPHVESSFDPTVYSKVGAAGMWQFMRATGRRYLRIDDAVDERLDPFRSTEAAAQLLDYNFRFLDSWPLALTAYNHGAAGMRRARDSMGTTDITTIVRGYQSKSFGFASRNFYVSFLAALTIDRDPGKYFTSLQRHPELRFTEVEMPAFVPVAALVRTLKVEKSRLAELNPALLATVWEGRQYVPKGYRLRLPEEAGSLTAAALSRQVDPRDQYTNQPRARSHRLKAGETLAQVARKYGVSASTVARLNGLKEGAEPKARATLRLPDIPATRVQQSKPAVAAAVAAPAEPAKVSEALAEQRAEDKAVAALRRADPEPVSAAQAKATSPGLAPGGAVARASEPELAVSPQQTIRVGAEESIGLYARWLQVPASRLRNLNNLATSAALPLGLELKLDFSKVPREQFDARRGEFHDALQASFFAANRIVGTQMHVVRRGDSLWAVSQRYGSLPAWLLMHYNPDIDFAALRAGQQIVIPKIETAGGARVSG